MKLEKNSKYIIPGIVTLLLSAVFSLFASSQPDGLERVAIDAGFIEKESSSWTFSLFPDYKIPAFPDSWIANSLAGVVGVVLIFGFVFLIGNLLTKNVLGHDK